MTYLVAKAGRLPVAIGARHRWLVASALASVLVATPPASAQPATTATLPAGVQRVQSVEGITEYRLANGLKVLFAPDAADAKVTVNLTYLVGSRHEGNGETGMAHLLEHLIFKGTPTTPDPKAEFQRRAFAFNGTTSADRTNYYATFTSTPEALDWYLGWQADAMVNSFIAKRDLDSEMAVVRNEYELAESNPFQVLAMRTARAAYSWHGYGRATIGARADIENVDIARLKAFYQRYYRPDNAVLMVAGAFDPARTLAAVHRTLGRIDRPATAVAPTYTLDTPQDGERSVVVRRPATAQVMLLSYHVPPALHPDSAPLQVLATALGQAPAGRLHKALVEAKLSQGTFAGLNAQREGGQLLIGAAMAPSDDPSPRQKVLLEVAEGLAREPLREDEFARAKLQIEKSLEQAFANAAAVANGALNAEVAGDWRATFVSRDRLKSVTLDDVNRVARTYLLADNRTLGHLIPTAAPARAPHLTLPDVAAYLRGYALREQGEATAAFDFSPAALHRQVDFGTTPGGLPMAVLNKPVRGDMMEMRLQLRWGRLQSLHGLEAAADATGEMLLRGTTRLTRQQLQDELTRLGAALNLRLGVTGGTVTLKVKKEHFPAALQLLAHVLREPSFDPAQLDELKAAMLKDLDGSAADQSAQAGNAWSRYGNPYARGDVRYPHTIEEWRAEWQALTPEHLRRFHQRFYGAQAGLLSVLGPMPAAEVKALAAAALDGWRSSEPWEWVERPMVDRPAARLAYDTPDKANTSVTGSLRVPLRARGMEADFFALEVATRAFGGGPGSRLWTRLREAGGMSYDAGASLSASFRDLSGEVSFRAEVAPANLSKAEAALAEELQRALREGFSAAEVARVKQELVAERQRGRSGDGWALGFMALELEHKLQPDERERNDALIAALTPEQVNAAWRKYVAPERIVWGIFGDQRKAR